MVKHIVLFAYHEQATQEQRASLHKKFSSLPSLIPEIAGFESGKDISVEEKHHGFTDAYVLTFPGSEERDRYLVHPHHREFTEQAGPLLKDVLVFDYAPEGTA